MTSDRRFLGSRSILGLDLAMFVLLVLQFWQSWPYLVSHVAKTQNRINSHSLHISPLKPTPSGRLYWEAKSVAWICSNSRYYKSYDVIKILGRHSFINNMYFNKSMLQILDLNALYPLAFFFFSLEKDVSCVSLYGFCVLITWLTKYGYDYQKWRQPPIEPTWPKTKRRKLREFKKWRLELILSNHFVVKGLPP